MVNSGLLPLWKKLDFKAIPGQGARLCVVTQKRILTACQPFPNNLRDLLSAARSTEMTRRERQELERKLAQTHRLALEPTDALTRELLAQRIEDLEFQLLAYRLAA